MSGCYTRMAEMCINEILKDGETAKLILPTPPNKRIGQSNRIRLFRTDPSSPLALIVGEAENGDLLCAFNAIELLLFVVTYLEKLDEPTETNCDRTTSTQ